MFRSGSSSRVVVRSSRACSGIGRYYRNGPGRRRRRRQPRLSSRALEIFLRTSGRSMRVEDVLADRVLEQRERWVVVHHVLVRTRHSAPRIDIINLGTHAVILAHGVRSSRACSGIGRYYRNGPGRRRRRRQPRLSSRALEIVLRTSGRSMRVEDVLADRVVEQRESRVVD